MATNKSDKPLKDLSSRQHAFLKAYAKGKTLKQAAIEAVYLTKNADQSGYQALKAIKGRAADLMDEIGLTDQFVIENYLVPLLEAKGTKFVHDRGRLKQRTVQALEASGTQPSILHSNFVVATLHAIQRKQSSLGLKS